MTFNEYVEAFKSLSKERNKEVDSKIADTFNMFVEDAVSDLSLYAELCNATKVSDPITYYLWTVGKPENDYISIVVDTSGKEISCPVSALANNSYFEEFVRRFVRRSYVEGIVDHTAFEGTEITWSYYINSNPWDVIELYSNNYGYRMHYKEFAFNPKFVFNLSEHFKDYFPIEAAKVRGLALAIMNDELHAYDCK